MFQVLKDTHFDFMAFGRAAMTISAIAVVLSLVALAVVGLNLGIEFSGGTEVQLKYAAAPDLGQIRSALGAAGLSGYTVTSIGEEDEYEVYVRLAAAKGAPAGDGASAAQDKDPTARLVAALRGSDDTTHDLNVLNRRTLAEILAGAPGVTAQQAEDLADRIVDRRREVAIFHSVNEAARVEGMTPEVEAFLVSQTTTGRFAVRSQSYVGPAIGKELQNKAGLAVFGSLLGMLAYIWIRFEFQWGVAAVVALAHDTIVTLGLFALFQKEMSLAVVAAFLTLIGYSVNDTVVIFDRVRENLKKMAGEPLEQVINVSINQTLSRTIITSGLTFLVVLALLLFGGEALNPFAFVLTVGIVAGSYSTICVASPFLLLWKRYFDKKRSSQDSPEAPRAKKVRAGTAG